jgi:integrase
MAKRRDFGSVRRLPSGRYQVRYVDPTGERRKADMTFATKADAHAYLATIQADMARGVWIDPNAGRITLRSYSESWLEARPTLRPRTRELYAGQLRNHIIPTLGEVELADLTPPLIRHWYADLITKRGVSPITAAKVYRLLRTILTTAVEDELLLRNPANIRGAGIERSEERPVATVPQLWALARAVEPRYRALVLTAGLTGMRFGELAGLERRHVDLDNQTIRIAQQQIQLSDGTLLVGPPKTDAGRRTIALPPVLIPYLTKHLHDWVGPEPDARVFAGEKGGALRPHVWLTKWRRAVAKVGVEGLRFHDLRHTANTLAASTGASTRELMHRMGHASSQAALRYQHATQERDTEIAQALSDLVERGRPPRRRDVGRDGPDIGLP